MKKSFNKYNSNFRSKKKFKQSGGSIKIINGDKLFKLLKNLEGKYSSPMIKNHTNDCGCDFSEEHNDQNISNVNNIPNTLENNNYLPTSRIIENTYKNNENDKLHMIESRIDLLENTIIKLLKEFYNLKQDLQKEKESNISAENRISSEKKEKIKNIMSKLFF